MVEPRPWTELSEGDEFAGYRIERRLGRGGMGILYLAVEPGLERRVALKLIAPEAAADEVFARRFAEESRIAASIEHPNVVPIYAAGEERGVPFIALRYVAGSDLGRRIAREGRLTPDAAAALIAQVGNGLDAIHAAGLVHRDVKPANVLLSGEPGSEHAYITDFGVARNVATESGLTQTGRFVGTLDYVAPEQISGQAIDARVDVYALGCLLFKLLTGEVPFPREGEAARLYAHLNDPPPAPSLYAPAVPMAIDDIVARAMAKSAEDRFPSAGDLGRAAEAALTGITVSIPERTVATGAAATRDREALEPEPRQAPTEKLPAEPENAGTRRPLLLGGLLALIAAAVVVALIASGGGAGDGDKGGKSAATADRQAKEEKPDRRPRTLTRQQLIRQGDGVCADSRATYKRVRDPVLEEVPDVAYSEKLVAISSEAVRELNELEPPRSLERAYRRFVDSQEQVKQWDTDALRAAEAEDATAYLEAREDRNQTEDDRKVLAEDVGFSECGGSDL
jgi:Protein kinase domain